MQALFAKMSVLEKQFDTITDYYSLMKDYSVPIPDLELASFQMMNFEYGSCKEAMEIVNEGKAENIKAFSSDLVKEVQILRNNIIQIRAAAQNPMILSAGNNNPNNLPDSHVMK